MKAITVKYAGPTNTRGSRFIAKAEGVKTYTVSYNHAESADDNAERAARLLAIRQGWTGNYVQGTLPDGATRVYVCVPVSVHAGEPLCGAAFSVLKGDIEMHRGMGLVK